MSMKMEDQKTLTYLNQKEAQDVDVELMGSNGFSIDQLMELAGLSVASAITQEYSNDKYNRVLIIAGPGNNGGDGLVAARHLTHFGYKAKLCYPRQSNSILYNRLLSQCISLNVETVSPTLINPDYIKQNYDIVLDAIFGFSFKGDPRPPFDSILNSLKPDKQPPILVSVDIPSGWDVELGDQRDDQIKPNMLISLTTPKLCAKNFKGIHYLGGRFVPPEIISKYKLNLPHYPKSAQCVKLEDNEIDVSQMRISYNIAKLDVTEMVSDPFIQFNSWFKEATKEIGIVEANAMTLVTSSMNGQPTARVLLLKGIKEDGFVFYTNYNSRKGKEIEENNKSCILFYWERLQRQVRIEGIINKISEKESDDYFMTRPRESQLGAWASNSQSSVIEDRSVINKIYNEVEEKYKDKEVLRPPFWGGYQLKPNYFEFWQGGNARLHDRIRYQKLDDKWIIERLSP